MRNGVIPNIPSSELSRSTQTLYFWYWDDNTVPETQAYCTLELVSSVSTIDPTFNIDKYSATSVIHQDILQVSERTGEHMIRVDMYTNFVCSIQKNCPGLKDNLRAFELMETNSLNSPSWRDFHLL